MFPDEQPKDVGCASFNNPLPLQLTSTKYINVDRKRNNHAYRTICCCQDLLDSLERSPTSFVTLPFVVVFAPDSNSKQINQHPCKEIQVANVLSDVSEHSEPAVDRWFLPTVPLSCP